MLEFKFGGLYGKHARPSITGHGGAPTQRCLIPMVMIRDRRLLLFVHLRGKACKASNSIGTPVNKLVPETEMIV